ncbi:MAG: sodium:solute symporter family protein [Verrucomicrobia bacterium]|nr:sodium:solute symporter family protein [Verrucomicrobiota bacterium]
MNALIIAAAPLSNIPVLAVVIVAYLAAIGYLGYRGYAGTKTSADFMVAGRRIHPWVMALSYGATFISTSAIVGFGSTAGMFGFSLLWLAFLNIFVGIFIAFVFFGKRTRKVGHNLDAHTFPEILARRYNSRFIQGFSGLVIFLFMPLYTAAVLIGASRIIAEFVGLDFNIALLVFAVIVAAYVIFGGLKGVMYTDALQGTLMFIGMAILLVMTYSTLGGVTPAHEKLTTMAPLAADNPVLGTFLGHQGWTAMPRLFSRFWWVVVSSVVMGVGIGVLAQPQLAVRFMTVRSNRELNRAVLVGGVFIIMMVGVAFVCGSLSNAVYQEEPETFVKAAGLEKVVRHNEDGSIKTMTNDAGILFVLITPKDPDGNDVLDENGNPKEVPVPAFGLATCTKVPTPVYKSPGEGLPRQWMEEPKTVTDEIMPRYLKAKMPPWFLYVFMVTILAAAMSTISSQFHTMGTSVGRDFYEQGINRGRGTKATVLTTRIGMLIAIVATIVISYAIADSENIIAMVTALFFGLCAAAFLPAYVGALYWRGMTRAGATASIVTGFVVSFLWLTCMADKITAGFSIPRFFGQSPTLVAAGSIWTYVEAIVIALPLSAVVAVVVSLMTKPEPKEHLDKCFRGVNKA